MKRIEKIEAILDYFETGVKPQHLEVSEILLTIDKLKESAPDKYLSAYRAFVEWNLPLLQRTTVRDSGNKPKLNY